MGYKESHPFLRFQIELRGASPKFWMLLGEGRSKCDHIRHVPLGEDVAKRLHLLYLAKGVGATTAIEGNSLLEEQVQARIEGKLELPPSKEYLGIEVDNMLKAYNGILNRVAKGEHVPISAATVKELNRQILEGLSVDDHVVPGQFRTVSVVAGNYLAAPAADIPELIDRLCEWLETGFEPSDPTLKMPYAFIKAVVAHVYLEWIHPFGDGNGRLGRLVEFLVLISSGVPSPAAHVLTSHYNDTRTEYYRQLGQASRNGGDLCPFLSYAAQGFVDGLTATIKVLHTQQERLMWRALVDRAYMDHHSAASQRQRLLAIEIAAGDERRIMRSQLRRLTPELAEAYAGKTPKMLSRDLNRLEELGFLRQIGRTAVEPQLERVRGMRPLALPE